MLLSYLPHLSFLFSEMARTDVGEDIRSLQRQLAELDDAIVDRQSASVPIIQELERLRLLYSSYRDCPASTTELGKARAKQYWDLYWEAADRFYSNLSEYNQLRCTRDVAHSKLIRAIFKPRSG